MSLRRFSSIPNGNKSDKPLREKGREAWLNIGSARGREQVDKESPASASDAVHFIWGGEVNCPASPWADEHEGVGTSSGRASSTRTTPVAGVPSVNIAGSASGKRNCNVRAPADLFSSLATPPAGHTPSPPFPHSCLGRLAREHSRRVAPRV